MQKNKPVVYFALLIGVIIVLGYPLLGPKFIPTHDGEYHIIRFMEFYKMLSYGYLFPRWAPDMNSGFGIPIFLFHYPFPNYIGSLFHVLGFQFVDAFKLALFSGYLLAGIFCFLFLSKLWGKKSALFGSIAALTVPYWFVDIYVRGSVGEVWAIAWMFAALTSIAWKKKIFLSLSIALLILSHNIQALIFFPFLVLFALRSGKKSLFAIFLGIVLAAYFWVPALVERIYVVGLSSVNPLDHFASLWELLIPSWGTQFSGQSIVANKMSFQIGMIPIVWLILAGWRSIGLAAIAILLMLPVSHSIWTTIPGLDYIQYPWRLLSLFIPLVGISAAYVSTKISIKKSIGIAVVGIVLVYGYARPATYERRLDAYYATRENFTDGTSSMGNAFSTIWTPWKEQRVENLVETTPNTAFIFSEQKPLSIGITLETREDTKIKINRLYFPGWTAYDNQKQIEIDKTDGLIAITLGTGVHHLFVRFEETPVRRMANAASFLGLLWLLGSAILEYSYAHRNSHRTAIKRTR